MEDSPSERLHSRHNRRIRGVAVARALVVALLAVWGAIMAAPQAANASVPGLVYE